MAANTGCRRVHLTAQAPYRDALRGVGHDEKLAPTRRTFTARPIVANSPCIELLPKNLSIDQANKPDGRFEE